MTKRPAILYKYLPPTRLSVLAELRIRFTQATDFNDPFESFPRVAPPSREALLRRLAPSEDLAVLEARAADFFQVQGPDLVFKIISQTFGVLSLAEGPDNPLLWAHYGGAHRGFAIGFNTDHPWLTTQTQPMPPIDDIQPVVYQEERPTVTVRGEEEGTESGLRQEAAAMLFTKSHVWQYEREWRLVRLLEHSAVDLPPGPDATSPIHLFNVPPGAISEVVVGARMASTDVSRVVQALAPSHLAHVRLRVARRSATTFALDVLDHETV